MLIWWRDVDPEMVEVFRSLVVPVVVAGALFSEGLLSNFFEENDMIVY